MADTLITGTTIIEDKRSEKGEIWSCSGANFKAVNPEVADVDYDADNGRLLVHAATRFIAPVFLPQGATVTAAEMFGIFAGTEQWTLFRTILTAANEDNMASADMNTEDKVIENAIIDNDSYSYTIGTTTLAATPDTILGARIKYEF
jgi:hypothetical protein